MSKTVKLEDEIWAVELYNVALKYGKKQKQSRTDESIAYDFAGWIIERLPERKLINLNWWYIDYLRHTFGDTRTASSVERRNVKNPLSWGNLIESIGEHASEESGSNGYGELCDRSYLQIRGRNREIKEAILKALMVGVSRRSISKALSISECRITQIVNEATQGKYSFFCKQQKLQQIKAKNKKIKEKILWLKFDNWFEI
jgi:hypothetical protein